MTYEFIGIFVLGSVLNDNALSVAALNIAASRNPSVAGTRPLARAPDTPSSTR
jgi:hypothetical protein